MTLNKILWYIWWIATIIVILGVTASYISLHHKDIQITLSEDENINFEVFRVLPDPISMQLEFTRDKRPWLELGNGERKVNLQNKKISTEQKNNNYKIDTSGIKFRKTIQLPPQFPTPNDWKNPGEPIKILFTYKKQSALYYAWPNTSSSPTRNLVPLNPNDLKLGVGYNNINMHIQKVGKLIAGEKVTLRVKPAIGLKSSQPNHFYFLKYFIFAPIYIGILIIMLIILLILKWQRKKISAEAKTNSELQVPNKNEKTNTNPRAV